jgi:putative endonuclease
MWKWEAIWQSVRPAWCLPAHLRPWPERPDTSEQGAWGEKVAASYLRSQGVRTLVKNFRYRRAELDLVCRDRDCLVFVEVKTRRSDRFGTPGEAVTRRKQILLGRAAMAYLRMLDEPPAKVRFDVVEIIGEAPAPPEIRWIANAFDLPAPRLY